MQRISLYLSLILLAASCSPEKVTDYDFIGARTFDDSETLRAEAVHAGGFMRKEFAKTEELSSISDSDFLAKFYEMYSGDVQRYFLPDANKLHVWINADDHRTVEMPNEYLFGSVIGQSTDRIFYTNTEAQGTSFCDYNLADTSYKLIELKDFKVFNVAETATEDCYIAAGAKIEGDSAKLGFYQIDANNPSDQLELHSLALTASPYYNPELYAGAFYTFGKSIYFLFANHSDIFEFDDTGKFVRVIKTVDQFTFQNEKEGNTDPAFKNLYRDLAASDEVLLVRTSLVSGVKDYLIVFDAYEKGKGSYSESMKVGFYLKEKENLGTLWTFMKDGNYHVRLKKGNETSKYDEFKLPLAEIDALVKKK